MKNNTAIVLDGSLLLDKQQQLAVLVTIDYVGSDGQRHQAINFDISGDKVNGYTVNRGTVRHPAYGVFEIETLLPVVFACPNGKPSSGKIVATGNDDTSLEVSFPACSQYQVCMNNSCSTYSW